MQNDSIPESTNINTPPVISKKTPKIKLPHNVKLAILLFGAVSSLILTFLPQLYDTNNSGGTPPIALFATAGVIVIVFSALLFNYLFKAGLGLNKTSLIYAFGLSLSLAFIKLVIAPQAFYTSASRISIDTTASLDPNTFIFYLFTALGMFLLYALVFRIIYRHFYKEGKIKIKKISQQSILIRTIKTVLKVALIMIVGGILLIIPLLTLPISIDYIFRVFSVAGIILLIAVGLALYCAVQGFRETKQEVIKTANVTLWTSFFWLGLSLILVYHIMWIVFMAAIVNLWPLHTTSSK
jgi:hypothetical protein